MSPMNKQRLGGIARARSLSETERSRIARHAANSRWSKRETGILGRDEIRDQVVRMLADRDAVAYLFGSYARGEAGPSSDVDLMVVEKKLPQPRLLEIHTLRERLSIDKDVDLIVVDAANFEAWKNEYGTVQHEAYREGIRLV